MYPNTQDKATREQMQLHVYNQITDEMLTKPVNQLTMLEQAMLESAFRGPHGQKLIDRIDGITSKW